MYLVIRYVFVVMFCRTEAEALLKDKVDGTFMIRESNRRPGEWAVALK